MLRTVKSISHSGSVTAADTLNLYIRVSDMAKTPDISDRLYRAMWDKLEPGDFDPDNDTDAKLLEYLGWLDEQPAD